MSENTRRYGCTNDSTCPTFLSDAPEKPTVCPYCASHGVEVVDGYGEGGFGEGGYGENEYATSASPTFIE